MSYSVIISFFFFPQSLWIYVAVPSVMFSQCAASCQSYRVLISFCMYEEDAPSNASPDTSVCMYVCNKNTETTSERSVSIYRK